MPRQFELVSDLHLDCYSNRAVDIIANWRPQANTLVIAGDLCEMVNLREEWIDALLDAYRNVIYVPGNHDYYRASLNPDTLQHLKGLHVLTRKTIECDGIKFAGATLWFPHRYGNRKYEHLVNDFNMIGDYAGIPFWDDVDRCNRLDKEFFAYARADVWVTHHLPFAQSIHPRYAGQPSNLFFYGALEEVLDDCEMAPQVVVHGHTHEKMEYSLNGIRVYCNPFGYPGERNHPAVYQPRLIELP